MKKCPSNRGNSNSKVAKTLNAKTIAGGANNQVNSNRAKDLLRDRGVLIAPDYVINAGGIIAATAEYEGSAAKDQVLSQVDAIFEKVLLILEQASATGRSPIDIADAEAERLISAA